MPACLIQSNTMQQVHEKNLLNDPLIIFVLGRHGIYIKLSTYQTFYKNIRYIYRHC